MGIKINEIRNLRLEASSEHRATINFEAGDRRYHIWVGKHDRDGVVTWGMETVIHSNPIDGGSHRDHRELNVFAEANAKVRIFIAETMGRDINILCEEAVKAMHVARQQADQDHRKQLATNVRQSIRESDMHEYLKMSLLDQEDEQLLKVRGACYGAEYPKQTFPSGVIGFALTTKAAA